MRILDIDEEAFRSRYDAIRSKLSALSLPHYHFFDLTALFDDEPTDIFIDGCHFGERGNDRIAQALRDRLGHKALAGPFGTDEHVGMGRAPALHRAAEHVDLCGVAAN